MGTIIKSRVAPKKKALSKKIEEFRHRFQPDRYLLSRFLLISPHVAWPNMGVFAQEIDENE